MTTLRMYRCNLCHDYIKPTDSTSKEGFGIYEGPRGGFAFKAPHECENHICHQCAKSTHDEWRKVMPEGNPTRAEPCGS